MTSNVCITPADNNVLLASRSVPSRTLPLKILRKSRKRPDSSLSKGRFRIIQPQPGEDGRQRDEDAYHFAWKYLNPAATCPPVIRVPSTTETSFVQEVVHTLDYAHLSATWMTYIPSRLGHDKSIDAATLGLIGAVRYATLGFNSILSQPAAATPYFRALSELRLLLERGLRTRDSIDFALLAAGKCLLDLRQFLPVVDR
jgi:hypothetical protein